MNYIAVYRNTEWKNETADKNADPLSISSSNVTLLINSKKTKSVKFRT